MGLASAQWYQCPMPRKRLKELMQRRDAPAIRDTLIWFASFLVSGGLACYFWPTWAALPFFLVYGVLYGSSSDSRWHECGHGTAFKTRWMNDAIYHIACFMIMREPTVWRWSHTRHHTDTIIVGPRPGNRRHAPGHDPQNHLRVFCHSAGLGCNQEHAAPRRGATWRGGGDLHSGNGAGQGLSGGPHLAADPCRGHCDRILFGIHPADAVRGSTANHVRGLGPCYDRPHPAWRACRRCARPPPQQPHGST